MSDRKPSPYWLLRKAAEDDSRLSFAARHIFNKILSMRASKGSDVGEEFPLPWSKVAKWLSRNRTRTKTYLNELEVCGYLMRTGIAGCPPTRQLRIIPPISREIMEKRMSGGMEYGISKGSEKRPFKGSEKRPLKGSEKRPHHYSRSFRQGSIRGSLRSREGVGKESTSLRSQKVNGKSSPSGAGAPAAETRLSRAESARALREFAAKEFAP